MPAVILPSKRAVARCLFTERDTHTSSAFSASSLLKLGRRQAAAPRALVHHLARLPLRLRPHARVALLGRRVLAHLVRARVRVRVRVRVRGRSRVRGRGRGRVGVRVRLLGVNSNLKFHKLSC